jgi:HK97 gp10 family phage protein
MIGYKIKVEGLKDFERAMKEIPEKVAKKYLRGAVSQMGIVVRDAVRANAPVETGLLRRNIIYTRSRSMSGEGRESVSVMVRQKTKRYSDNRSNRRAGKAGKTYKVDGDAYYWKFLEFGTSKMPKRPFFRQAFEGSKMEAIEAFKNRLQKVLGNIVRENKIK